jgi:hypothetical protein
MSGFQFRFLYLYEKRKRKRLLGAARESAIAKRAIAPEDPAVSRVRQSDRAVRQRA